MLTIDKTLDTNYLCPPFFFDQFSLLLQRLNFTWEEY